MWKEWYGAYIKEWVRTIHILQHMILEVEGFDKRKQKVTIKGQTISIITFHNVTSSTNERKIITQTWPEVKSQLIRCSLLGEVTLWNRLSFNGKRYLLNQTHLKITRDYVDY